MRRLIVAAVLAVVVSLASAVGAQAVVLNVGGVGKIGVALVPGSSRTGLPIVTSSPPCADPALSADLRLSDTGLCFQGGAVLHRNETFDITWDPNRSYWATTKDYIEQFLRDVADGSGTLSSPYALTTQYSDAGGRAGNNSLYGGGCTDFGVAGGSCAGAGHDYPPSGCAAGSICLTDAQLKSEVATMVTQQGLSGHLQPGYSPLLVVLTPPGVVTCLDAAGTFCSVNGTSSTQFCSYHSQVDVGGTTYPYVVQPWTTYTACDEPQLPALSNPTPQQIGIDAGTRLVNPLSQAQLDAIVDPGLGGWLAIDGSGINDNGGCHPLGPKLDTVTVGHGSYVLQREFNNGAAIVSDPNTYFGCAPDVLLSARFVAPSAVSPGDVIDFDGSKTVSTLVVPNAGYRWNFGDGTTAVGPSVVHTYATGGNYTVTLTVTDRGGNTDSLTQTVSVLGPGGSVVPPPNTTGSGPGLDAHIQLLPQGLRGVLRSGVSAAVTSNEPADGIATLLISRSAARRAHIPLGRGAMVVVGRGTVSGIKDGTVNLHLRLSRAMAAKLRRLRHLTLTVRLALVAVGGDRRVIDAAGRY
jgi:hypothetical protein